jgi:hypothetical protein
VVRVGLIGAGILFCLIALIAYYLPISFTLAGETMSATIPQMVAFCESGFGQFAQLSPEVVRVCSEYNTFMFGFYGSGLLGIILIIVGVATSGKKESSTVCSYCNFVGKTEAELLDHKAKNHLDKSPYKCGECDFIGITEEILWNHYNDKHPDKKKW